MIAQRGSMQGWLNLAQELEREAAGDVVSRRSPLDLWRLSGVRQINDTWFEFTMTIDSENLRSEELSRLGRRSMVIRANADRMPAIRSEESTERALLDFKAMAMIFICDAAVQTQPDSFVDGLPAYVWPTWIREEVSA